MFSLLAGLTACGKKKAAPPPPPVVEVLEVTASDVPLTTTLIGQLDSPGNVEVRARVEGFVDKMLFTEGTEVEAGAVLFALDDAPFRERLAAAEGAQQEAVAALTKYEADVNRLRPLVAAKAIPKQDLDNAEAAVEVGKASLETAKARVESARLDLGYCTIKAPVAGLIGAKQVSIGELVGKGQPTLMATISTLDPMWFYCNVSEVEYINAEQKSRKMGRDVSTLPVTLILPNGQEHPEQGKFVFIDRAVDAKTGTLRVRAEFPNPEKLLRPGMFARARVDLGTRTGVVLVPERVLVQLQGRNFVWLVSKDGTAHQQQVVLGEQVGQSFIVNEGLKVGDRIILEGIQKAREGAPVTAVAPGKVSTGETPH